MIAPKYDDIQHSINDNFLKVQLNGKWGYVDQSGKEVTVPKYDAIEISDKDFIIVNTGGKRGLVNQSGKEVVAPKYDAIEPFYKDVAIVNIGGKYDDQQDMVTGGKWGMIDKSGKEVIAIQYDAIQYLDDEHLIKVQVNGKRGYLNFRNGVQYWED